MELKEAILRRRSVRVFNRQPVPEEAIRELLESAMAAPSAHNRQPWEFYVVKDQELRQRLRGVSRYSNMDSSLIIVVAGNGKRFLSRRIDDFWIQDCSAAVENLLLSAAALGLGSCWCGLFPLPGPVRRVREILGLEEHILPLALVHLGYSDRIPAPRTQYDEGRVHVFEETGGQGNGQGA